MVRQFSHLAGMDVPFVYDCGNGTAGTVLPEIFGRIGLKARGIFVDPDGRFPNHHPDPSVEENLADIRKEMQKGVGLAFAYDGDADRIAVITSKHNIKGDQMALLFSLIMEQPTVIGEVKCSQVMYDTLEARGAKAVMYKTGHSNLKVKIKELDADLACEVSGHIFFNDRYYGFDDAIYATLRILELIKAGIDLDAELEKLPKVYSTEEIKIETTEEEKFALVEKLGELLQDPPQDFPAIKKIIDIDGVRVIFEKGWGLIRPSNTTPVLVARFESDEHGEMKRYESAMNDLLEKAKSAL
jgi:phosphomannomutase/phosphoglucomutase